MIFDDHDIRDDWNTSLGVEAARSRQTVVVARADRRRAGVVLGLPAPRQPLARTSAPSDEIWQRIVGARGRRRARPRPRRSTRFAERVDQQPETYRWSYARDFGDQARLVVVDSRAARVLDARPPLDARRRRDGLVRRAAARRRSTTCSSAPRCRSCCRPGCTTSRRSTRRSPRAPGAGAPRGVGEKLRQAVDLEHWAAFQDGFRDGRRDGRSRSPRGERGRAPRTVTFLSGDVHHSYVAEVGRRARPARSRAAIVQAVCSPIRNPLPRFMHAVTSGAARYGRRRAGRRGRLRARRRCPTRRWHWGLATGGPGTTTTSPSSSCATAGCGCGGRRARSVDRPDRPVLRRVATIDPIG